MESLIMTSEGQPSEGPNDAELAKAGEAAVNAGNTHGEETNNPEAKEKPEWVPDKFWNPQTGEVDTEGMAKSYRELEKLRSNKPVEGETIRIESVQDAQKLAAEKGIDFNAVSQEFNSKGELSEETYKSLADKGIPKDIVQQFVEGQRAAITQQRSEVLKQVGGEEVFKEMASWAQANMQPEDLAAYNKAVASGDIGIIKLAVGALQSSYKAANGQPPKTQIGGTGKASSAEPYESRTQYVDAIKDPRYERDSAYRAQVVKRLEASSIF
jgi:hypothetical protein